MLRSIFSPHWDEFGRCAISFASGKCLEPHDNIPHLRSYILRKQIEAACFVGE